MEEAGSRVAHRRKKGDRQPGVMHCDLAAFEASAHDNKYCLVAAMTIEVDKESKLLPIFVPMPKKDTVCALAAIKEALSLCQDRNLHQITGSRVLRIQADGGGLSSMLGEEHHLVILSSPSAILKWYSRAYGWYPQEHSLSNAKAGKPREKMVVTRMQVCRTYDERESSRMTMAVSSVWSTCGNMEVS